MLKRNRRACIAIITWAAVCLGLVTAACGQTTKSCVTAGGGFFIPELMVVTGVAEKQVIVADRMATDALPKEYQSLDIRKDEAGPEAR